MAPSRYHQHEMWDPPADKLPPEPRVLGPNCFDARRAAAQADLFGARRPSHGDPTVTPGDDAELGDDDPDDFIYNEPAALCDGRTESEDDHGELHSLNGGGISMRSKFQSGRRVSKAKLQEVGSSCSCRRICCLAVVLACGAAGAWRAKLRLVDDSEDAWNGSTEGRPVVLRQGSGFLSVEGFADSGETGVFASSVTSNRSIWIPVNDQGQWRFRSNSLVRISKPGSHWIDADGYWYLSQDCRARNWNAEEQLFTLTKLDDHRFDLSGLAAACGGPLSILPYRDCAPLVESCLARCVNKFGKTIAEGNARYCAKGCAATKGGNVVSEEVYCYLPRHERQPACMERCEREVDQEKMVPKCQYGCGFWAN